MLPPLYRDIVQLELTFDMKKTSKHVALVFYKHTLLIVATNTYAHHAEEVALQKLKRIGIQRNGVGGPPKKSKE